MLYELVAGHRPFEGPTDLHVLQLIQHGEPAALRRHGSRQLRALIAKALAKDPDRRYQSMKDLAADLAVQTTPRDAVRRVAATSPRRRRALLAGSSPPHRRCRRGGVASLATGLLLDESARWRRGAAADGLFRRRDRCGDFAGRQLHGVSLGSGRTFDAWISPTGSGRFINMTKGRFPVLYPGPIRYVGFSDDNSQLWFIEQVSVRPNRNPRMAHPGSGGTSSVPGERVESCLVARSNAPGTTRPTTATRSSLPIGTATTGARSTSTDPASTTIPDVVAGRTLHLLGVVTTDEMDLWRFPCPRTVRRRARTDHHHNSRVAYPAWLDPRTLIYSATADDGSAQWLYAMDVRHRIPHRVSSGISEQYLSVAATTDARRLVVTVAMPLASLWSVPVSSEMQPESSVRSFAAPNARALSPRFGPDYVLMLSSKGGADGLWKMTGDLAQELWRGSDGGLVSPPAVSPDGTRIAFAYRTRVVPRSP